MIWSPLQYLGVASQGFPWFSPPLWLPTIIVLAATCSTCLRGVSA